MRPSGTLLPRARRIMFALSAARTGLPVHAGGPHAGRHIPAYGIDQPTLRFPVSGLRVKTKGQVMRKRPASCGQHFLRIGEILRKRKILRGERFSATARSSRISEKRAELGELRQHFDFLSSRRPAIACPGNPRMRAATSSICSRRPERDSPPLAAEHIDEHPECASRFRLFKQQGRAAGARHLISDLRNLEADQSQRRCRRNSSSFSSQAKKSRKSRYAKTSSRFALLASTSCALQ